MKKTTNDFLKRLLSTFTIEAGEHINALSAGLVELESVADSERRMEIVETVFREAHSLKGAARAVNCTDVETICQSMESVLSALKHEEITLSSGMLDILHRAVNRLTGTLSSLDRDRTAEEKIQIELLTHALEELLQPLDEREPSPQRSLMEPAATVSSSPQKESVAVPGHSLAAETVRISVDRLESILLQAEEMLSAKLTMGQQAADLHDLEVTTFSWRKEWKKVHVDVHALQRSLEKRVKRNGEGTEATQVARMLEFLEWNQSFVRSLGHRLMEATRSAASHHRHVSGMVDNLLDGTKRALMLPFSTVLEMFPKFVRDLSRDQGKEVTLVVHGAEIEADRRILEEMKTPLIHLVRNCIDHGIEKPSEREGRKKPAKGTITIAMAQVERGKVEIVISDDGAGINVANVRSAAMKFGMVHPGDADALDDERVLSLIFQSGITTNPMITDVSGRGLGLAIVREKVERLGGTVTFETRAGIGTSFRILLPLTLATLRGLLVRTAGHVFVVPIMSIARTAAIKKEEITSVENRETIQLDGMTIPLVQLSAALELSSSPAPASGSDERRLVVVLASAGQRIAFLVDDVLHELEVLVKSLGPQLARVKNVSGATVLGTGTVVPILYVPDLMKSAVRLSGTESITRPLSVEKKEEKKRSLLVVEDSITARTLLKSILETAGYNVATAVDGVDAFTQLRTNDFDVVISDVDMPRMNGFDLTKRIRDDKKLAELPVVLVTALESREDRERGVDVGANAYIVKSSFDQSNLLGVLDKLA